MKIKNTKGKGENRTMKEKVMGIKGLVGLMYLIFGLPHAIEQENDRKVLKENNDSWPAMKF